MEHLRKQLLGFVIEELGYSRLRLLSFKLQDFKITEIQLRVAILKGSIRRKYKSSKSRIRSKDFVVLSYVQEELEPYYVSNKLTLEEKEWINTNFDISRLKDYMDD
jgi:hypothetical protein